MYPKCKFTRIFSGKNAEVVKFLDLPAANLEQFFPVDHPLTSLALLERKFMDVFVRNVKDYVEGKCWVRRLCFKSCIDWEVLSVILAMNVLIVLFLIFSPFREMSKHFRSFCTRFFTFHNLLLLLVVWTLLSKTRVWDLSLKGTQILFRKSVRNNFSFTSYTTKMDGFWWSMNAASWSLLIPNPGALECLICSSR